MKKITQRIDSESIKEERKRLRKERKRLRKARRFLLAGKQNDFSYMDLNGLSLGIDYDDRCQHCEQVITIRDIDFSGSSLKRVDFGGHIYINCDFSNSNLEEACFDKSQFINCKFDESIMEMATMVNSSFTNCSFIDATSSFSLISGYRRTSFVSHVVFDECDMRGINLSFSDMENSSFVQCMLDNASFKDARMCGISFDRTSVSSVDFSGADLDDCKFDNDDSIIKLRA